MKLNEMKRVDDANKNKIVVLKRKDKVNKIQKFYELISFSLLYLANVYYRLFLSMKNRIVNLVFLS